MLVDHPGRFGQRSTRQISVFASWWRPRNRWSTTAVGADDGRVPKACEGEPGSGKGRVVVRAPAGAVRGCWAGPVAVFRGIPYAEAPVGTRRFGAPVPASGWDGVRDAVDFGPCVPQPGHTGAVMVSLTGHVGDGSADCLTLNVWTPDPGSARLPVMVWIQGGTYLENHTHNPHYDAALLAETGVVVVSISYRVGADGFARIEGAPDNRGILDQITALGWVRDNIAPFGGDPGNVTVFGQSAGGACIAALLVMPAAKGLFRRAICQSMPGTYFTPRLATSITQAITTPLGVQPTIEDLTRVTPRALTEATAAVIARMPERVDVWGPMALTPTPFSPVVDGEILSCAPWQGLADGAARDVELLVGHTRDEFRLYTSRPGHQPTASQIAVAFENLAPSHGEQRYRAAHPDADPTQLFEMLTSDWLFRMPSLHLADAAHAGGGRVRIYELAWSFNSRQGASHCLDFLLVFGTLSPAEAATHPHVRPNAARELLYLGNRMRSDWTAFALNGSPGWALYDPRTRTTRVYDTTTTDQTYPHQPSRRIWSTHRFGALELRI
ncbi:carboxylesterase/lipase family protein [Nocardia yunnanensis]|uniref:Carboxylic ester hydrolase n=1 Tax=Nocardia yunnanensis TaxID=2382165 RepID=A0A386ZHK4_9NOCA|nr:carboxylesterase family protein [Nocardia yunnanensis]AYF76976.1 carboxylesterase/lipase family protein [Nocardia yunnanensis]